VAGVVGGGPYLGRDESLQHVDALHDDEGLQQVHLELQALDAEAVELGEGGGEERPQDLRLLGGTLLQPALGGEGGGGDSGGYVCIRLSVCLCVWRDEMYSFIIP